MTINALAKKVAVAAMLSGVFVGANATNSNLGLLPTGLAPTLFAGFAPIGDFTDNWLFSLPANGGSGYSVANFAPSGLSGTFNTVFSSLVLVSNPDGVLSTGDEVALASAIGLNTNSLKLNWSATSGGNYYLKVIGETNGTQGGLYSGGITVTPVPEPESYAMFLAGLGVMGAIAVRRNKSKKQG